MKKSLRFIDLFAGIGGFRIAFESAGCKCVFSSECDSYAAKTYEANFGERPFGDINTIDPKQIPDHEILTAGFPCQPFSVAGVSKNNALGRPHGFDHLTQGNLFFSIVRILQEKKPSAFVLENVKNLRGHDKGRTYKIIMDMLVSELGYSIYDAVIDSKGLVPQHRERIYIVGFRPSREFCFPIVPQINMDIGQILESNVDSKYTLSDRLWNYLENYANKHKSKGNGFGYGLVNLNGLTRTLSARYYKDGSEILIPQNNKNPRRLTPRECARLMGFPDTFKIVCSDTRAYKQFGNSVVVPLVQRIAFEMIKSLNRPAGETKFRTSYQLDLVRT